MARNRGVMLRRADEPPGPPRFRAPRRTPVATTPFRLMVLDRAGHRCDLCGAAAVEALDGARRPAGDGAALCRACHVRMN